jgi:hypothetical protein
MIAGNTKPDQGSGFAIESEGFGRFGEWVDYDADPYANARLIAAAPDLLAACEAARNQATSDPLARLDQAQIVQLDAAIAKATGKDGGT